MDLEAIRRKRHGAIERGTGGFWACVFETRWPDDWSATPVPRCHAGASAELIDECAFAWSPADEDAKTSFAMDFELVCGAAGCNAVSDDERAAEASYRAVSGHRAARAP